MRMVHGTIPADGAELYYQATGNGAPVLILQGGLGEASATDQLAALVAPNGYRVISYDRRGLSRSTITYTPADLAVLDQHAADAARILDELVDEPAHVVGASIGALIGLHLAINHPSHVSVLVAHEPPMPTLVPDRQREADMDKIEALAERDPLAAIQLMGAITAGGAEAAEPDARPPAPVGDLVANLRYFFAHDFPALRASTLAVPDVKSSAADVTIVPTGGISSRAGWEYRCADALAAGLGRSLVELPGAHNGLVSNPQAVSSALLSLFGLDRG